MRTLLLFSALALSGFASVSVAQADREGSWELGFSVLDTSSIDVLGANGSSLDVSSDTGFGITANYNFTDRLAAGFDLNYSSPRYRATLVPDGPGEPEVFRASMGADMIHFKGIYNFLEGDVTPYVEVGAGWTYLDSNIVSGISGPVCWWDPWWGYVCYNYFDTYTDTRTSHSYGVGIRWDVNRDYVVKASWGVWNIDTSRAVEDIEIDTIQLSVSWKF